LQAQPLPLWHSLSREMQLSPQALPAEQTLQQAAKPDAAQAGDAQLIPAGPMASEAAASRMELIFMATLPGLEEDAPVFLRSRIPDGARGIIAAAIMMNRKYEVRGTDDLDDVHAFRKGDRDRAEEMLELMREDLKDVELVEL